MENPPPCYWPVGNRWGRPPRVGSPPPERGGGASDAGAAVAAGPAALRHRHHVLDASGWISVIGILAFVGAMWGPDELRAVLVVVVAVTAAAASLHALARPALLRWANPSRDLELPGETQALLAGTAVRSVGVAAGTVSEGGTESDNLRLRVGTRVLLSPVVADVDPRRLAALALTAGRADRGVTAPAALWACVAVLAGVNRWWTGVTVAVVLAGASSGSACGTPGAVAGRKTRCWSAQGRTWSCSAIWSSGG
jgi:hypothetical protein